MRAATLLVALLLVSACAAAPTASGPMASLPDPGAEAVIMSASGAQIGRAEFRDRSGGGVRIRLDVQGLTPGAHGVHIHQQGVCEGPNFTTAGPHLKAPGETDPHGLLHPQGGEAGDLPNLVVRADGRVQTEFTSSTLRVMTAGAAPSVVGRAIVIHALPDDQRTQPIGGSGDRIACGVIRPVR